ncbi:MAG: hypothetical protein COC12_07900 [Rhodobacteraceae bacterium]|nr:MAG: hypothetical protein COC12_07900 [Paracoccaceae bacterium]
MFKFKVLGLLIVVAGCTTPKEECLSGATQDYRTVQSLISETNSNIARGYAVHSQSVPYTYQGSCYSYAAATYYSCQQTGYRTQQTPVAIDVNAERVKLANYRRLLPQYEAQARAAVSQCNAQFPEDA